MKKSISLFLILILIANSLILLWPQTAKADYNPTTPPTADYFYIKASAGVRNALSSANVNGLVSLGVNYQLEIDGFYQMDQQGRLNYLINKILANAQNSSKLGAYNSIMKDAKNHPVADENGIKNFSVNDSQKNMGTLNLATQTYLDLWAQFYYDAKDFTKKCTWSQYDINLLHSLVWPDLIANKSNPSFTPEELTRLAAILQDPAMVTAIGQVNQGNYLKEIWHQIWTKGNDLMLVAGIFDGFGVPKLVKGGWKIVTLLRDGKLIEGFGTTVEALKSGTLFKGAIAAEEVQKIEPVIETTQNFRVPVSNIFLSSTLDPYASTTYVRAMAPTSAYVTETNIARLSHTVDDFFQGTTAGQTLIKRFGSAYEQTVFDNTMFLSKDQFLKIYFATNDVSAITVEQLNQAQEVAAFTRYYPGNARMPFRIFIDEDIFTQPIYADHKLMFADAFWHEIFHSGSKPFSLPYDEKLTTFLNEGITEYLARKSVMEASGTIMDGGPYQTNFRVASALNNMLNRRATALDLQNSIGSIEHYYDNVGLNNLSKAFEGGGCGTGMDGLFKYLDAEEYGSAVNYLDSLWGGQPSVSCPTIPIPIVQ